MLSFAHDQPNGLRWSSDSQPTPLPCNLQDDALVPALHLCATVAAAGKAWLRSDNGELELEPYQFHAALPSALM